MRETGRVLKGVLIAVAFFCAAAHAADGGFSRSSEPAEISEHNPLKGAKFVKHFSEGDAEGVKAFGAAQTGKLMRGLEYLKSLRRGGDGHTASFLEGGYVIFGEEAAGENFASENGEFTLHFRMRSKWGHWRYPLLDSLNGALSGDERSVIGLLTEVSGVRFNYHSEDLKAFLDDDFLKTKWAANLMANADFSKNRVCVGTPLRA